ncbi:MAG: CDP-diacylglycerol--serine O-phosphatidyltransferase [Saprospiraceae bacterium]|nr:CDP-diacylglycerol--serine O-phosphatidyltransferase [Saprospiraceae bacterium]
MKQYIPTLLTAGNLVCGFTAIMIGDFYWSPILLLCCFLFDSLDGLVARMLNAQSEFGKQMDSLADVISFGVAPAYLYSLYSPDFENRWYTISTCALIVVAGTIRLAKFNITPSKPYFMGLPIPANALFYIGVIIAIENESSAFIHFFDSKINYFITPLFLSLMMVSFPLRMFSTKSMSKDWRDNFFPLLMAILSIVIFFMTKFQAVAIIIIVYIILSVVHTIFSKYVWHKL